LVNPELAIYEVFVTPVDYRFVFFSFAVSGQQLNQAIRVV